MTCPWFSISFQISSLISLLRLFHLKANHSSILDSPFMWNPAASGPAYFSLPCWCVHFISETVRGKEVSSLMIIPISQLVR